MNLKRISRRNQTIKAMKQSRRNCQIEAAAKKGIYTFDGIIKIAKLLSEDRQISKAISNRLALILIGYVIKRKRIATYNQRAKFTVDFNNSFFDFANDVFTTRQMNSEKYNAVVRDIDKIQQELGRDGVINEFVDPLKGIRGRNYQLFMNIVPEMRNMLLGYGNSIIDERVNQLIGLCEDSLRRHIGNLERAIEHERKGIFNPITCLGEGIRWIVGLPVDILQWAGLYSAGRSGKIKASFLFRVISNAQYYPKWFRFKDEHIADFGVLVTSSNNTAVENITKELPLEKGILDNLKIVFDGNMPDSPEMAQQLRTICKMFSTSETEKKLNIYQKDTKRQGEYPEIYFTGYAKKFFGNAEKDADAWGMVAAPLGKKSNISGFYYDVLNPILQDFMIRNADIEDRIPEYRKARDAFSKQLEIVSSLQSQLKSYGDISLKAHQLCASFEQIRAKNISLIICCDEEIKSFENQIVYTNTEIKKEEDNLSNFTTLYSEADFKLKESEKRMKDLSEQEISYKKQALDVENSVGFFTKIFRKSKYQSALDLAECFRLKAQECTIAVNQASHKIGVERAQVEKYRIDKDNALQRLHESKERLKKLEENKSTTQMRILRLKGEINNAQVRAEAAKSECERDLREYLSAGDMKTGKVLDDTFIEDVLSKNDKVSTKAQITNPWSTEEFNREREKLFYLALQMTKEFVLSSKSCRTNLCILGELASHRNYTQ